MAYVFQRSDGTQITVSAGAIDNTYSLGLIGQDTLDYGETIVRNTVHHLENFAASVQPPGEHLTGQLWYDSSENIIRVFDGANWKGSNGVLLSDVPPTDNLTNGVMYYNTVEQQLYIYNNLNFLPVVPPSGTVTNEYAASAGLGSKYGTKIETLFLTPTSGSVKAVMALKYISNGTDNPGKNTTTNETIMGIISDHPDTFTVSPTDSNYNELNSENGVTTTIRKGLTFREDYLAADSERSNTAGTADSANAITTTSSVTINADNIFHKNDNIIPGVDSNFTIGNQTTRYSTIYTDELNVGRGGALGGSIIFNGTACEIGTSSQGARRVYTEDILVHGNVVLTSTSTELGSSTHRITNGYFGNVNINSTAILSQTPTENNHITHKGYVDSEISTRLSAVNNFVPITGTKTIAGTTTFSGIATFNGAVSFSSNVSLSRTPTAGTDVTNKTYVDNRINTQIAAANLTGYVRNTGTKSISGQTTFNGNVIFNETITLNTGNNIVFNSHISGTTATFTGTVTAPIFSGQASSARYSDLAEMYESDENYDPGTLVKIGGEKEVTLMAGNSIDYFGVVSTKPGYLMNSDAKGLPIALKGRVPVKVIGTVQKGQRLVPSVIGGVAEAFQSDNDIYDPRIIVGRALEDKIVNGVGLVEAVVGVV